MSIFNLRLRQTALGVIAAVILGVQPLLAHAESVVGNITQVVGKAHVKRGTNQLDATAPMPVELHDEITTLAPGEVTLQMLDNSVLTLNESSVLRIDESLISGGTRATTTVGLLGGSLKSVVSAAARGIVPNFKVQTPNAIAGVRGTVFTCRYSYGAARSAFPNCLQFTDCATTSGSVAVTNNPPKSGVQTIIGPGQISTVACLAAPTIATAGTLGVLTGPAGASGAILGPAAIVGVGAVTAGVIGGTTAAVLETTGGGGGTSSAVK
jgi:hypothetical protein